MSSGSEDRLADALHEYSETLQLHGVGSVEAAHVRSKHESILEFGELASQCDRLESLLGSASSAPKSIEIQSGFSQVVRGLASVLILVLVGSALVGSMSLYRRFAGIADEMERQAALGSERLANLDHSVEDVRTELREGRSEGAQSTKDLSSRIEVLEARLDSVAVHERSLQEIRADLREIEARLAELERAHQESLLEHAGCAKRSDLDQVTNGFGQVVGKIDYLEKSVKAVQDQCRLLAERNARIEEALNEVQMDRWMRVSTAQDLEGLRWATGFQEDERVKRVIEILAEAYKDLPSVERGGRTIRPEVRATPMYGMLAISVGYPNSLWVPPEKAGDPSIEMVQAEIVIGRIAEIFDDPNLKIDASYWRPLERIEVRIGNRLFERR